MEKFMNENVGIKFEMSHEDIDELIMGIKEKKRQITADDVARIHAHISSNGGGCKECCKKVEEAGIIIDFNGDLDGGK